MIKIEFTSVRNPQWVSEKGAVIKCWVKTNTLIDEVEFAASINDPELHGRELFARCLAGEFGEIAPMATNTVELPQINKNCSADYLRLDQFLHQANLENNKKSFRSVVIVWAALLDNLLDEMLEDKSPCVAVAGLRSNKLPTTFGGRIKLALESCLIEPEEEYRCRQILHIRNAAAHEWKLTLASKDVLKSLRLLYEADHAQTLRYHEDLDYLLQLVYSSSCAMLALKFMSRLKCDEPEQLRSSE